jgi:hypothetical protein
MKKIFPLLVLSILILFAGCQKDDKLEKRLEGNWNIAHYENIKIFNDGTTEVVAEADDAGYFLFYRDPSNLPVFDFEYTAGGNTQSGSSVYYMIDDHAKRVIIIGGTCIGCDLAYTIDENTSKRQVWSIYSLQQQGLSTDFVYKKKFVLEK